MKLHVVGIDLGKTVFHLVGLDSTGKEVIRKKGSRTQLLAFTANLKVQLIGMESCSGSHFLGPQTPHFKIVNTATLQFRGGNIV